MPESVPQLRLTVAVLALIACAITMGFIWEYGIERHRATLRVENQTSTAVSVAGGESRATNVAGGSSLREKYERGELKQVSVFIGGYRLVFDDADGLEVDELRVTIEYEE